MAADFLEVERRLRTILAPYAPRLTATEGPAGYKLELPGYEGKPWGYVGGTRIGKRYVSYYLMSVYARPALIDGISPELARRRQGKACFNFTSVDESLFAELADLTARGMDGRTAIATAALATAAARRRRG